MFFAGGALTTLLRAQTAPVPLDPVFTTASRATEPTQWVPFSHVAVSGDEVRSSPNASIDQALRAFPGFGTFRRSDSLVSNASTQGVSLRGLGPSAASRSLVLLDGVPLNDAFGGWVVWSKVPRESLARVELIPGAGGTAWGNAALGGVIQLLTEPPTVERERLAVRTGSFGTTDAEAQLSEPAGSGAFQLLGRYLTTDGYDVVAREQRGPIDRPAASRSRWVQGSWRQSLSPGLTATVTYRAFGDDRGNGTPYQRNHSAESFGSVSLRDQASSSFAWNAAAYASNENFNSTFSAVNATRTAETPASNQFAVPATALGASWVGEWTESAVARTTAGADVRDVRGENREDSAFVNGAFTRRRISGGRQTTAGVFVLHSLTLLEQVRVTAGLRADDWSDRDGHRRDGLIGQPAASQVFPAHDGVAFSPSGGVLWPLTGPFQLHASAQHAFRRPTLNELYRPFRVGNVITDANPNLKTETVTSAEVGATLTQGPWSAGVTAFSNDLHDSVANVTTASGPTTVPGIGVVPAGGEARRKMNLDRTRVQGVTANVTWRLAPTLTAEARYLYDDATVRSAPVAPWLVGRRLAQVPRHNGSLGLRWTRGPWSFDGEARWMGGQFEDDRNSLRLAAATVIDVGVRYTLSPNAEIFVSGENLWNHRVETGRSPDGLVNVGLPRLVLVGFRLNR